MLLQLIVGSMTILLNMAIMVGFLDISIHVLSRVQNWMKQKNVLQRRFLVSVSISVILVLTAATICVWVWALLFRILGVFSNLEQAVYFAVTSFTTVGYGDVVVGKEWRVLSGFISVNGLLAFGLFTAFLIEVMRELSNRRIGGK